MIPVDDPDIPEDVRQAWTEIQEGALPESGREIGSLIKRIAKVTAAVEKNSALLKALLQRIGTIGR
jgi:ABC-type transporter Mla subunit MlaD